MRGTERNDFVNKLKEYDIGILMNGVDKIELYVCPKSKYKKYAANRMWMINEQDEILSFLISLNLSEEKRGEIEDVIFFNDFYKIDELSYLSSEQKEDIKKKLLGFTITWQKAARFLLNKGVFFVDGLSLFLHEEAIKILNETFQVEPTSAKKKLTKA